MDLLELDLPALTLTSHVHDHDHAHDRQTFGSHQLLSPYRIFTLLDFTNISVLYPHRTRTLPHSHIRNALSRKCTYITTIQMGIAKASLPAPNPIQSDPISLDPESRTRVPGTSTRLGREPCHPTHQVAFRCTAPSPHRHRHPDLHKYH